MDTALLLRVHQCLLLTALLLSVEQSQAHGLGGPVVLRSAQDHQGGAHTAAVPLHKAVFGAVKEAQQAGGAIQTGLPYGATTHGQRRPWKRGLSGPCSHLRHLTSDYDPIDSHDSSHRSAEDHPAWAQRHQHHRDAGEDEARAAAHMSAAALAFVGLATLGGLALVGVLLLKVVQWHQRRQQRIVSVEMQEQELYGAYRPWADAD